MEKTGAHLTPRENMDDIQDFDDPELDNFENTDLESLDNESLDNESLDNESLDNESLDEDDLLDELDFEPQRPKIMSDHFEVAEGVWGQKDMIVNFYMIEDTELGTWVLVDAGLKTSAPKIKRMAAELFGEESRPECIILTHGHFDHVGALETLADEWDVPIYAHRLELPYLTGLSSYPPPDPTVGGGLMARLAWLYPKGPIYIGDHVEELPENGVVPHLADWQFIHTPGHAPGHISLFRESDRVLIAGDAFVTTQQESLISVLFQKEKLSGPPKYFTPDWTAAATSVRRLAELKPETVATGHGRVMRGDEMRAALDELVRNFGEEALPKQGRYVDESAIMDEEGVEYVPPRPDAVHPALVLGACVVALALSLWGYKQIKSQ